MNAIASRQELGANAGLEGSRAENVGAGRGHLPLDVTVPRHLPEREMQERYGGVSLIGAPVGFTRQSALNLTDKCI